MADASQVASLCRSLSFALTDQVKRTAELQAQAYAALARVEDLEAELRTLGALRRSPGYPDLIEYLRGEVERVGQATEVGAALRNLLELLPEPEGGERD